MIGSPPAPLVGKWPHPFSCIGPRHRPVTKPGGIPMELLLRRLWSASPLSQRRAGCPSGNVTGSPMFQAFPSHTQVFAVASSSDDFFRLCKDKRFDIGPPTPPVLVIFKVCSSHLYCLYSFVVWEAATDKWSECSSLFKHLFSVACGIKLLLFRLRQHPHSVSDHFFWEIAQGSARG